MKFAMPLIATAFAFGAVLMAQEPPSRPPATVPPAVTPTPVNRMPGQDPTSDAILITWLMVDSENEIALSRIALQRAQSPAVRQFAQKMIDDHGQIVQKLQQVRVVAGNGRVGQAGAEPAPDPNRDPLTGRETGAGREGRVEPKDASGVRPMGLDHDRLIRDLGKKRLESATAMLQEKQAAEFDRCFMAMQLGAHMKAVDTFEVFRDYASPSLRPTLEDGLKTVQGHLQHIKDLTKRTEVASFEGRK